MVEKPQKEVFKYKTVVTPSVGNGYYRTVNNSRFSASDVFSVLKIIILIVFAVTVLRVLQNKDSLTLETFLDLCANSPTIPTDWIKFTDFSVSWGGILKPISIFLNTIGDIFSFALFVSVAAANVVLYAVYFMRYLFL